ncbi:hypothetical protein [Bacillus sp. 03113]|uniref:hypothetical protein n=1 Tax=Bacillus sp. 03113 TaxID=2578211 RepID=UPI00114245E1|nr:hypothetical protein [Bacillus sp. 03113]
MKSFQYEVIKIDGALTNDTPLDRLRSTLNLRGGEGYRLHSVVTQIDKDKSETNLLIFERVHVVDENILL